jgi:16S rRNA G966 N2-methylase RsmD
MILINGEALGQLKLIPNKSVDFVYIDPPYEWNNHGCPTVLYMLLCVVRV